MGRTLLFWCPGCKCAHVIPIGEGDPPRWTYNDNPDKPTFRPSINVTYNGNDDYAPAVCHSFVTDGMIEYLGDSTHHLAGQTVEIPPWEGST